MTTDQLKYQVYDESEKLFPKTLQMLYAGAPEECKEALVKFLDECWADEEADPALRNFLKQVVTEFKEKYPDEFGGSNLEAWGAGKL